MSRKLTAKQVKELASFHKKAAPKQRTITGAKVRFVTAEEAAKLWPGIVSHYVIKAKRPPNEDSAHE